MIFAKDLYVLCAFIAAVLNEIHGKITLNHSFILIRFISIIYWEDMVCECLCVCVRARVLFCLRCPSVLALRLLNISPHRLWWNFEITTVYGTISNFQLSKWKLTGCLDCLQEGQNQGYTGSLYVWGIIVWEHRYRFPLLFPSPRVLLRIFYTRVMETMEIMVNKNKKASKKSLGGKMEKNEDGNTQFRCQGKHCNIHICLSLLTSYFLTGGYRKISLKGSHRIQAEKDRLFS